MFIIQTTAVRQKMEQKDIKTLKILEAFHQNPGQTQRDLSKKLKISLGMVNAFTRRLARKGYFKVTTIPKRRIQYILTPKGLTEKSRLTYRYLLYSIEFYKETRERIKSILNQPSIQNKKKIFIIGANEFAEIAIITLQELCIDLAGVIDNKKAGEKLLGTVIKDASYLTNLSTNDLFIITESGTDIDLKSILSAQKGDFSIIDFSKSDVCIESLQSGVQ
jgi:DNA-binding MarR family transcriptional regulator